LQRSIPLAGRFPTTGAFVIAQDVASRDRKPPGILGHVDPREILMPQHLHRRDFIQASAAAATAAITAAGLSGAAGAAAWMTIDAHVHAYERNHPGRPWAGTLVGPAG
jgi:hypothetical protein